MRGVATESISTSHSAYPTSCQTNYIMQHSVPWVQMPYPFPLCNDYSDILKGPVWLWRRRHVLCPIKIFAQCVSLKFFRPVTPSVSSMWFPLTSTYMLYFLVFLFFVMISLIRNTVVRVQLYSVDRKPLQFPLIVHYMYMSCGASTKTIYVF